MAHDDRPRVDVDEPLRPGLRAVVEARLTLLGAGLHQGARRRGVGPRGTPVGGGCRGTTDGLGLRGHRLRQGPHDLAQRAADGVLRVAGVVVAVEHCHDQAEGLGGAERQGRKPQAAADAVTAVRAAEGLDGDACLAEDDDVPPRRALGHAELVGDPFRRDARAALDELQGEQRPCRGARVRLQGIPTDPEPERPECSLACGPGPRTPCGPVPQRRPAGHAAGAGWVWGAWVMTASSDGMRTHRIG